MVAKRVGLAARAGHVRGERGGVFVVDGLDLSSPLVAAAREFVHLRVVFLFASLREVRLVFRLARLVHQRVDLSLLLARQRAVGLGLGDVRVGGVRGDAARLRVQSSGQALGARGAVAHRGVKRAVLLLRLLRDPGVDRAVGEERVEGLVGTETVGRTAGQSSREEGGGGREADARNGGTRGGRGRGDASGSAP